TSSIPILEISVWASPDSLTSGTLVTNELVALDLTMCVLFLVSNFHQKISYIIPYNHGVVILVD
ncbi:hypothetical protein Q7V66_10385, partial [Streptococcus suis]|nr:hypothetical protein [Streptococcus suis]